LPANGPPLPAMAQPTLSSACQQKSQGSRAVL
jgi:hypothetical protein